ncbi:histidine phosphatase superfamily protein [Kipferlia bialata]|uniref:Histidine phosphatase superfamily protein n=1 Tax=Kipferlia bialata TaxID=797122 RepID=A0A9K3D905_9EUKA|nr:histidine phosphatase superfamily protein [Kipferlia bialata]|eukprot:g14612.t1
MPRAYLFAAEAIKKGPRIAATRDVESGVQTRGRGRVTRVLAVSHGGFIKMFPSCLFGQVQVSKRVDNCSISIVRIHSLPLTPTSPDPVALFSYYQHLHVRAAPVPKAILLESERHPVMTRLRREVAHWYPNDDDGA